MSKEIIRILHCLPGNMNQGGIENFIMNIYRKIDREKFQFDFIVHSADENYYEKEIKKLGGKIYRVEYKTRNFGKYKQDMEKILKEHKEYKIIHVHSTYAISLFDVLIGHKYGLKVITHAHSSNDIMKRKLINILFKRKLSKITDYKFACSMKAAKWLFTKSSINKNEITIINNAIDTKKFLFDCHTRENQRKLLGIEDNYVIGVISRLSYLKNIDFLIEIFSKVAKKDKSAILLIVGNGPEKLKLEEKVEKMSLTNRVVFLGEVDNNYELLQAMDVFVLPSKCEGFGIALIEAQAAGLKCFTSKDVVPREVQIEDNINKLEFISLKKKPEEWAYEILKWNNNYKRLNTYKEIINAGYDLDSNIESIENKYIEILGEN